MGFYKTLVFVWLSGYVVPEVSASPPGAQRVYFAPNSTLTPGRNEATGRNASIGVDDCWTSWSAYLTTETSQRYSFSDSTHTLTQIFDGYPGTTETASYTTVRTETLEDAGFTLTTRAFTKTVTYTQTVDPVPATTEIETYTNHDSSLLDQTHTAPKPGCTLPASVSQCQSQWEDWVSTQLTPIPTLAPGCTYDYPTVPPCASVYDSWLSTIGNKPEPSCSQASIGGTLCQSAVNAYISMFNDNLSPDLPGHYDLSAGWFVSRTTDAKGSPSTVYTWPTHSQIGHVPSCTVGCGRCAVTGGTVQLIYWPATATPSASPTPTAPVTVVTLGTTFTSPTLYISYSSAYASDGCTTVGTLLTNTIVAIPPSLQLSSIYGLQPLCNAHNYNQVTHVQTSTAPFNITDMNEPVPQSIYAQQPWCQSHYFSNGCVGACPSIKPYEPILVVPEQVLQAMQGDWASCYPEIRGVYDPPIALHPVTSIQKPTLPPHHTENTPAPVTHAPTAVPASTVGPIVPFKTPHFTFNAPPKGTQAVQSEADTVGGDSSSGNSGHSGSDSGKSGGNSNNSGGNSGNSGDSGGASGSGNSNISGGSGDSNGSSNDSGGSSVSSDTGHSGNSGDSANNSGSSAGSEGSNDSNDSSQNGGGGQGNGSDDNGGNGSSAGSSSSSGSSSESGSSSNENPDNNGGTGSDGGSPGSQGSSQGESSGGSNGSSSNSSGSSGSSSPSDGANDANGHGGNSGGGNESGQDQNSNSSDNSNDSNGSEHEGGNGNSNSNENENGGSGSTTTTSHSPNSSQGSAAASGGTGEQATNAADVKIASTLVVGAMGLLIAMCVL